MYHSPEVLYKFHHDQIINYNVTQELKDGEESTEEHTHCAQGLLKSCTPDYYLFFANYL